jgi:hypothetical protein
MIGGNLVFVSCYSRLELRRPFGCASEAFGCTRVNNDISN